MRRLIVSLATLALLPASASAAEPDKGSLSAASPKVEWTGKLQNPYLLHNLYNYENTAGRVGMLPCRAPSCDTFTLENMAGGVDLLLDLTSEQTPDISLRIQDPSGTWTYHDGWSDASAPTKVRLKKAPAGTYVINVVARVFGSTRPTAVTDTADYKGVAALAVPPPAPAPATAPAAGDDAAPAPAGEPAPAAEKKPSASAKCKKKAKKIKDKRKRKAAIKRCGKKR